MRTRLTVAAALIFNRGDQGVWDEMFMIDLYPQNRERFGINMTAIVEVIVGRYPSSQFRCTLKQQGINSQ